MARYEDINARALMGEFIQGGRDHLIVDVRTPGEFATGYIPGAVNIPLDMIEYRTDDLPRGKAVVVVCQSGNRSQTASQILNRHGFESVYNLSGGTSSWINVGYDVDR